MKPGWLLGGLLALFSASLFSSCQSTYQRETIQESVQALVKKEFKLDVRTAEVGGTLGIQYSVGNMLGEISAGDQMIWKNLDHLVQSLSRVALSCDNPPEFIVLDMVDTENPNLHLLATQYVQDIKKYMGQALSVTRARDRFLLEFVVGKKQIIFDPFELDIVRIMMMAMEPVSEEEEALLDERPFELREVEMRDFVSKITVNTVKRLFREKKNLEKNYIVRDVSATFQEVGREEWMYQVSLELTLRPISKVAPENMKKKVLPQMMEEARQLLKSYGVMDFAKIKVTEKNSKDFVEYLTHSSPSS